MDQNTKRNYIIIQGDEMKIKTFQLNLTLIKRITYIESKVDTTIKQIKLLDIEEIII